MLKIVPEEGGFAAHVSEIPLKTEIVAVTGRVDDSLFNAVEDARESPELALRLAQIFGYDLDFSTDPRHGDTFRMVLEKRKYLDGQTAGYGKILAAEYENAGRRYQALLFHDPAGRPGYYAADGKSLAKAFLRSPLKFGAPVTSHFSRSRFHPILKIYRPHLGTDYGAPVGTPVQTIGSGRVLFAGRKSGEGNMIEIAHFSGYKTRYLHLSRMFVHPGERGAGDGAASRLPHSRKRAVQEFREAQLAALRSSGQKELARFRRGARDMAAAAAEPRTARGQCRRFERGEDTLIPTEIPPKPKPDRMAAKRAASSSPGFRSSGSHFS